MRGHKAAFPPAVRDPGRGPDPDHGADIRELARVFLLVVGLVGALVFVFLDHAFARPMAPTIRTARDVAEGGMDHRILLDRDAGLIRGARRGQRTTGSR